MLHLPEAKRLSPGGPGSIVLCVPHCGATMRWREVNLWRRLRLSVRRCNVVAAPLPAVFGNICQLCCRRQGSEVGHPSRSLPSPTSGARADGWDLLHLAHVERLAGCERDWAVPESRRVTQPQRLLSSVGSRVNREGTAAGLLHSARAAISLLPCRQSSSEESHHEARGSHEDPRLVQDPAEDGYPPGGPLLCPQTLAEQIFRNRP